MCTYCKLVMVTQRLQFWLYRGRGIKFWDKWLMVRKMVFECNGGGEGRREFVWPPTKNDKHQKSEVFLFMEKSSPTCADMGETTTTCKQEDCFNKETHTSVFFRIAVVLSKHDLWPTSNGPKSEWRTLLSNSSVILNM